MTTTPETPTPVDGPLPDSAHGWPETLFLVRFPDGRFACNYVTPLGPEGDEMFVHVLAVHRTEDSVRFYSANHRELPAQGVPHAVKYEEARRIAVEKNLEALALFEGGMVLDLEYLT